MRILCGALACVSLVVHAADGEPLEGDLRAATLYRAMKFIEWPTSALGAGEPFVICIVDAATPRAFDALRNRRIKGRTVEVRHVKGDKLAARECHLAFFPIDSTVDVDRALGKLAGMPVLTAGETRKFAQRGGMLALMAEDQRVRFAVNLTAVKRAGLGVSSQLLQIATAIDDSPR